MQYIKLYPCYTVCKVGYCLNFMDSDSVYQLQFSSFPHFIYKKIQKMYFIYIGTSLGHHWEPWWVKSLFFCNIYFWIACRYVVFACLTVIFLNKGLSQNPSAEPRLKFFFTVPSTCHFGFRWYLEQSFGAQP